MPNVGSIVRLTSGEEAVVVRVTARGDDDRVEVMREVHGVPVKKQVRITAWQIQEVLSEPEMGCPFCGRSVFDHAPNCDVLKPVGQETCG